MTGKPDFPGMNPYLEHPALWPEAPTFIIVNLARALNTQIVFQRAASKKKSGSLSTLTAAVVSELERVTVPAVEEIRNIKLIKYLKLTLQLTPMTNPDATPAIATVEALMQAYAAGQRNFSNLSLSSADLNGLDLKGADLSYADLSDSDLSQINLRGADLSYAVLRGANLTKADLRGASLIGTDLRDATLTAADFTNADYDPQETRFPKDLEPTQVGMRRNR